ncbi:lipoprotein-releasing ABC transporter permease subunit [Agaribacterium haliotis]|uniref:lipoprotein-releasing ABC transporter permease subunit n=1 Tax=Agaribacterium haliotis TaxID=2013869 RepID=UPI000BB54DAC|nr:lipoprotein-releasing ABC transporter permease subunit [Agaribacterium haliotis]
MLSAAAFIGLRYTRSKRSSGFMSFVSFFATGGMALGVFALIVVLSVMNGFDHELKQRLLRALPHAQVDAREPLSNWPELKAELEARPEIVAASPVISAKVLISGPRLIKGIELEGIDPDAESRVSPIAQYFVRGQISELKAGEFGIVLGRLLGYALSVQPGDKVKITLPKLSMTFAGVFPRSREFTVVGFFEAGAAVDQHLALIHLGDAQALFSYGDAVQGLRLRYPDLYQAPAMAPELAKALGEAYQVTDWSQTQGSLFQAVKLEKTVTGLLLGIIIAVAAFNIITSLIMMVNDKRSDIAVLRTMGLTRTEVVKIFITQGSASGFLGIALGLLAGVPVAIFLPEIMTALESLLGLNVFDPSVYFVSSLPSQWRLSDTVWILIFSSLCVVLATLFPAWRASLTEPAEAIRYDS